MPVFREAPGFSRGEHVTAKGGVERDMLPPALAVGSMSRQTSGSSSSAGHARKAPNGAVLGWDRRQS